MTEQSGPACTIVMQYKGKPKLIAEIGRELNAGTIPEGSVRKTGNRARVSIQMNDATEEQHVWAENYGHQILGSNREEISDFSLGCCFM